MPDYIYLLENRLSADQQNALRQLREATREAGMILFLTGDAVRDLTDGHAVRELEVAVHGNALKLKKTIEKLGGQVWGEDEASRSLYLCFPGTVRVDVVSTHRVEYPKPGKSVVHPASIQEDLRRRDFTANAMAISLNEGSFGLLMDPMNGVADIEARILRLVSNYGFLEEPSLLIRATRLKARLGWELDPRTQTRYDNAKGDGVIEFLSAKARSEELEQIGHEGDALKVLRALEAEGWMKVLFPAWTSAKADEEKLETLHKLSVDLLLQGVHADMSAAQMQLLTAKLTAKELAELKKLMLRPGFVAEWNSLDSLAAGFAKVILAKENATPSTSYKIFTSYDPEAILWLGFTSKEKNVQERFNLFLKVWPEARQRIPHALMQEMRITPELATYKEIVQSIFLELIDGRMTTPEEIRAFLEPHSPPAPPPQATIKRPRAKRGAEAKVKEAYDEDEENEDGLEEDEDLDDIGGDDDTDLGMNLPKAGMEADLREDADADSDDEEGEAEPEPVPAKHASKGSAEPKASKTAPAPAPEIAAARPPVSKPIPTAHEKPGEAPAAKNGKSEPKPELKSRTTPSSPSSAHKPQTGNKQALPPARKPIPTVSKGAPAHVGIKGGKVTKPASNAPKPGAKTPAKAAAKPPAKLLVQRSVKPPIQGSVKPPIQGSVKPPIQGSVKPPIQGAVKPPIRSMAKPVTTAAKAPAKLAPKGKPAPAKSAKAPAKASKPTPKKPAPKPAKKR